MEKSIDYVVPMVFPEDTLWQKTFELVGSKFYEGHARYRSWKTEHLLIQLVKKNMPFVRNIIIILAQESQKQQWMDEEGVKIVYHHEFIPQRLLPTFNSREIEMFLHKIPDLSDRFLYGNDDMYPLSPLTEEDFFVNGLPCMHMMEKVFPADPNNFQKACMGGMNFVAKEFGLHFTDKWYKNGHGIAPILKSTCEHLWKIGASEIQGRISPFREVYNFNQYIYSWWHFFSGKYVDKQISTYTSVNDSLEEIAEAMDKGKVVCVNDNASVDYYGKYAKMVREKLAKSL